MKPLDLQTTVGKSQDGARLGQPRDRLHAGAEQAVNEFRKDLEKKSAAVAELEGPDTARIEDGDAGGGRRNRDNGARRQGHARPKPSESEKDLQKGRIIDIMAGFLALVVFVMLY